MKPKYTTTITISEDEQKRLERLTANKKRTIVSIFRMGIDKCEKEDMGHFIREPFKV